MFASTWSKIVGATKKPRSRPESFSRAPSRDEPRAFGLADADVLEDGLELLVVDRRPDVRLRIESVADDERCGTRLKPLDELVRDRFFDDGAARGGAALAGGSERSLDRAFDGQIQIRVGEDDDRVLAPHLALALDAARRRRRVQACADVVGSRERHRLDRRMLHDRVADLASAAEHEVQHARREAALLEDLDDQRRGQRREARRLEDDGVARDERRAPSSRSESRWGSSTA